jgi:hypothetical protein
MHFETYDYITGDLVSIIDSLNFNALDFGDIIQGQHCSKPAVIRAIADTETNITDFKIILDKGLWKDSEFGYFSSSSFIPSIEAGSINFSIFNEGSPGIPIPFTGNSSDYIWLDIQVFQIGTTEANYQVSFNFS